MLILFKSSHTFLINPVNVDTTEQEKAIAHGFTHGNPYDGHTPEASIEQATKIAGWQPKEAYCDKGYRGSETIEKDNFIFL